VELVPVLDAALETVRPAAEAKEIRLLRTLDPAAGPVSGDPSRLQQVVWNLLSNAIKFTPRGGRVHVALRRADAQAEVVVTDTGAGIRPDFLPHVFDRFRQADASTTRKQGGLGLGLAIARNLVEMHGGTVSAESAGEGKGATFTVRLPLASAQVAGGGDPARHDGTGVAGGSDASAGPAPAHANPFRGVPSLRGVKVLVVDDEPDARALIRRVLEECQADVTTAASAAEAMRVFSRGAGDGNGGPPDVLVSDIGMPEMDGYALIRQVREHEAGGQGGGPGGGAAPRRVPAVALTAFARAEDRTRAILAGYQVHLSKPVEPAELIANVASLAGRTGTGDAQVAAASDE
jgi:CheY-like chemotaxis protein/anti-sigma regulatory factor (Ser/Thr protein kinase)